MKKANLSLSRLAPVGLVAALASTAARAEVDTAPITTALTEAGTAAAVVGSAVLVVIVGIKCFKYIRSAM